MSGGSPASRAADGVQEKSSSSPGREAVLSRIRAALRNASGTPLPEPPPLSSFAADRAELVRQLAENASRVDVEAHIATTLEDARATLQQWLTDLHASRFLYVPGPTLERLGISQISSSAPIPLFTNPADEEVRSLLDCPVGVNEAAAAVSSTGTIIEASGQGHSRLISLLPPVHISVVTSERIFPDLAAWVDRANLGEAFHSLSAFTLISGPSRTADIEQTLTRGVHGPGQMYMLVLDEMT